MSSTAHASVAMEHRFKPRRLAHVNMWVGNIEAGHKFYHDVIGLTDAYQRPAAGALFLSNGNTYHDIAIMDVDGPAGKGHMPGLNHTAFELETEFDLVEGYRDAIERGVQFSFSADHGVAKSVYLNDPDGNGVEIYADIKSPWKEHRFGPILEPDPPWTPGDNNPLTEKFYPVDYTTERIESAVFHTTKTAAATLVCADYRSMCAFYTEVIGLTAIVGGPDSSYTVLGGTLGVAGLVLVAPIPGMRTGMHHVGFKVAEDPRESASKLKELGIAEVLFVADGARSAAFVRDPSGILMRFHYDLDAATANSVRDLEPAVALLLA